jgi:hypothetical protein
MKKATLFSFLLLFVVYPLLLRGSVPAAFVGKTSRQGVEYYSAVFDIDPARGVFHSTQRVTVSGGIAADRTLRFYLGRDLVIDRLRLADGSGQEIELEGWRIVRPFAYEHSFYSVEMNEIEIKSLRLLPGNQPLTIDLEYHLPVESFGEGPPESLYPLVVHPRGAMTGGPDGGAFVMVAGKQEGPFEITIRRPAEMVCAVPGELAAREEQGGEMVETFRAESPFDPSFTCGDYNVKSRDVEDLLVEIYHPAGGELSEGLLNASVKTLQFFRESFGEPRSRTFKIVFPDPGKKVGGGESNGNLILLGDIQPFLDYDSNATGQDVFAHLIAHEGYHLWNAWNLTFEGPCQEWWVEGGANFMASWAKEELIGRESGAANRRRNVVDFDEQEAYLHAYPLRVLDEGWFEHYALVYDYGALVWEQLRYAIGSDALAAGLKDFYSHNGGKTARYPDLIASIQKHTEIDTAGLLSQWLDHNVRLDLILQDVTIQESNGKYNVSVDLDVDVPRDLTLYTALGYKTAPDGEWRLVNLRLTKKGLQTVKFEADGQPLEIAIDPEFRVPQVNPENNTWNEERSLEESRRH